MATEGFKRKLAAVFSADVAGYSRLMGEDEAATLTILEAYKETLSNAMRSAQKAVELDNSSSDAHAVVCNLFVGMLEYDKALEAGERAVKFGPNNSMALGSLANCLIYTGGSEEAIPLLRQAIRLDPFRSGPYRLFAHACRETGRYEEGNRRLQEIPSDCPQ
jgi:cytochrome c-type biogenesis protein CcmH/NrfG